MQNKILVFQGLRGWAIFLVFLSHCEHLYNVDGINRFKAFGGAGVSLFILLSGFLLAKKYIGSGLKTDSSLVLYKKRWSQFYKIHFITLLMAIPFSFTLLRIDFFKWFVIFFTNLTLIQTLFPFSSLYFSLNAVSWFLSIVMFFAVLTPVARFIWARLNCEKAICLLISVNVFEFILCYIATDLSIVHWIVYVNPFVRFLDFLIGGCLFVLSFSSIEDNFFLTRLTNKQFTTVSFLLFLVVLLLSTFWDNEYFATAIWTIPSSLIILALYSINGGASICSSTLFNIFTNPKVRYFGDISFEFFMVHQLMIRYFSAIVKRVFADGYNWYLYVIAYVGAFVVSCCFAMAYRRFFANN